MEFSLREIFETVEKKSKDLQTAKSDGRRERGENGQRERWVVEVGGGKGKGWRAPGVSLGELY